MLSSKMLSCVKGSSAIRAMFEDGKKLAAQYGAENVYDFSLGNPNLEPPEAVRQSMIDVLNEEAPTFVHGYMNNSGYEDVRQAIADRLNKKHGTYFKGEEIIMTCGAAGGLNVILRCITNPGEEIVVFAPYFGEYNSYAANCDCTIVKVPPHAPDFQPDLAAFERLLSPKTKAVIVNSPNNPTGVVYTEQTIMRIANILREKQQAFGTAIYLVADEPYRELVYDGVEVPYISNYYENTIIDYSWSKSLSLPGERIGYLAIPSTVADYEELLIAANVATRILGFINAPAIMQRAVKRCLDTEVDIGVYDQCRKKLYDGLTKAGYDCVKPEGAFYLFVKSPMADDAAFCEKAKEHRIIIVPGTAFSCPGYVRIAYCVDLTTIEKALPEFAKLIEEV